jgi:tetratricopeptide (TPR) repeat protein
MERVREYIRRAEAELKNGNWVGTHKAIQKAIELLEGQEDGPECKRLLSEALRLNAYAESRIGDFKSAVADAKRALELSQGISDIEGEADALRRLGYVHWQKTDYPMALEFYETALKKATDAKARKLVGKTMIELGNLYNSMNDFEKARTSYLQAAVIMKEEKELNELARIYNNLGDLYLRSKRYKDSLKVLEQCIMLADQIGDQTIKGWAAFNSANDLLKLGKAQDALEHLNTAMTILRRSDDRIGVMTTYMVYGSVYTALKEWDKAMASFKKASAIVKDLQMPSMEAEIIGEMGKMYAAMGDRPAARDNISRAIAMYENAGLKKEAAELQSALDGVGTKH